MHDDRTVAAFAQRLLGGDVGRGPDQQPAGVVERLGRQFVVDGLRQRTVGDLDRAAGAVQRLGPLRGTLVGRADGVRPARCVAVAVQRRLRRLAS
nr:hypothetical protein [Streptomyces tsukubensis NRRL18488]